MTLTTHACRSCSGELESILHLGNLHPSGFPAWGENPRPPLPLDLCACAACRLVQLRHTVDPDTMFRDHYWYHSGLNETMRAELADVVAQGIAHVGRLEFSDFVCDLGANDGTLLAEYRHHPATRDVPRVAFEPARNFQPALAQHAEVRIVDYFPSTTLQHQGLRGRVKVLTTIAMFYDLDEPHHAVEAVKELLHPQGVWIVQFQDLHQMIQATAFDNIVHEHLVYYSLASFERLIAPHGLLVADAEVRAINGGSYRLYVKHADSDTTIGAAARVHRLRQAEVGCQAWQTLERFAWRVGEVRRQIQAALEQLADPGPIDVYGASTKFNTLAQYCGVGPDLIRQAWERSPEKVGRHTVTGIPIVSEETGRADPPAALVCGIWQFREAILRREANYLQQGGTILFPLPAVDVVMAQRST